MLVRLLKVAAVAALCLAAAAQSTDAKSHSALRSVAASADQLQGPNSFIMPYKDTSDNMNWNNNVLSTFGGRRLVDDLKSVGVDSVVLAFATGECGKENWDGLSSKDLRSANLAALKAAGIKVRLSSGGEGGSFSCGSAAGFSDFVQPWIDAGVLEGVDFDIEDGQSDGTIANLVTRVKEGLQKYPQLTFSFTVATVAQSIQGTHYATPFPAGQAPDPFDGGVGATVLRQLIQQMGFHKGNQGSWPSARVRINPMAMDYGSPPSRDLCVVSSLGKCNMGQSAIQAAYNLNDHWGVPMSAIELTPMIGDNDTADESFSVENAQALVSWARSNGIAKIHYWAYDRDTACKNKPPPGQSSDMCNTSPGVSEHSFIQAMTQAASMVDIKSKRITLQ